MRPGRQVTTRPPTDAAALGARARRRACSRHHCLQARVSARWDGALPALRLRRIRGLRETRGFPSPSPACSTAATCTRSGTSAVAASLAAAGGWTGALRPNPTRSATSSLSAIIWWRRAGLPLTAWRAVACRRGGSPSRVGYTFWPDRWAAVIAEAPAVDLLNQMLDPAIPLTVNEYDEWGDPADEEQFGWMRAYTPAENVTDVPRPPLLVTGDPARSPRDDLRAGEVGRGAACRGHPRQPHPAASRTRRCRAPRAGRAVRLAFLRGRAPGLGHLPHP